MKKYGTKSIGHKVRGLISPNAIRHLVLFILRYHKAVLFIAVVLSVLSIFILTQMETNFSLRAFEVQNELTYSNFQEYQKHFAEPETEILIIILDLRENLNRDDMDRVLSLCQAIKEMPGHFGSLSLADMPINYDLNEEESALSPFEEVYQEFGYEFAIREMKDSPFAERFISDRLSRLFIYLQVPFHTGYEQEHRILRERTQELTDNFIITSVRFVGQPSFVFTLKKIFYKESAWFIAAYLLLFPVIFSLQFRDIKLILFSVLLILLSTLWMLACLVLAGLQLNFFGSLTFLLIFISCTSDIFHLLYKYRNQGIKGNFTSRICNATIETAPKSFMTSLSTAIGFGLLCFSGVPGLIDFGGYTAIGMMLAFLVTLLLAPALMKIFLEKTSRLRDGILTPYLERVAETTHGIIRNSTRKIIAISILFAIGGVFLLSCNSQLSAGRFLEIRSHHAETRLFNEIEELHGGLIPLYIYFHFPEGAPVVPDTLIKTTYDLERELAERYPYIDIDGLYSQLQMLAEEELDYEEFETLSTTIMTSKPDQIQLFYNDKNEFCRIVLRIKSTDIIQFIKERSEFLALFPYNSQLEWFVYTEAFNTYDSSLNLVEQFRSSILFCLIFFSALLGLVLRSWFVFVATTFINLTPLLIVYGIAVLMHIPAHFMVVAGFCVSLGIILDDSIYVMMEGYGKLRKQELSHKAIYTRLFCPLAATSFFILAGASTVLFSSFVGIHYFGIILLLNLAAGFIFDIFAGMALVYLRFKPKKERLTHEIFV